jgi:hypothetical protein
MLGIVQTNALRHANHSNDCFASRKPFKRIMQTIRKNALHNVNCSQSILRKFLRDAKHLRQMACAMKSIFPNGLHNEKHFSEWFARCKTFISNGLHSTFISNGLKIRKTVRKPFAKHFIS